MFLWDFIITGTGSSNYNLAKKRALGLIVRNTGKIIDALKKEKRDLQRMELNVDGRRVLQYKKLWPRHYASNLQEQCIS